MPGYLIDGNDPAVIGAWYRIDAPHPRGTDEISLDGYASALEWVLAPLGVWSDQIAITTRGQSIYIGNTVADPTFPASQAETLAADMDELLSTQIVAPYGSLATATDGYGSKMHLITTSPQEIANCAAAWFTCLHRLFADGTIDPTSCTVTVTVPAPDQLDFIATTAEHFDDPPITLYAFED